MGMSSAQACTARRRRRVRCLGGALGAPTAGLAGLLRGWRALQPLSREPLGGRVRDAAQRALKRPVRLCKVCICLHAWRRTNARLPQCLLLQRCHS